MTLSPRHGTRGGSRTHKPEEPEAVRPGGCERITLTCPVYKYSRLQVFQRSKDRKPSTPAGANEIPSPVRSTNTVFCRFSSTLRTGSHPPAGSGNETKFTPFVLQIKLFADRQSLMGAKICSLLVADPQVQPIRSYTGARTRLLDEAEPRALATIESCMT